MTLSVIGDMGEDGERGGVELELNRFVIEPIPTKLH